MGNPKKKHKRNKKCFSSVQICGFFWCLNVEKWLTRMKSFPEHDAAHRIYSKLLPFVEKQKAKIMAGESKL